MSNFGSIAREGGNCGWYVRFVLDVLNLDPLWKILSIGIPWDSSAGVGKVKVVKWELHILDKSIDKEGVMISDLFPTVMRQV